MTGDQDARTWSDKGRHASHGRMAIGVGVGEVERSHSADAEAARLPHQYVEAFDRDVGVGEVGEGGDDKIVAAAIGLAEGAGMVEIGGNALKAVCYQFLERADILILIALYADIGSLGRIVGRGATPRDLVERGQRKVERAGMVGEAVAEGEELSGLSFKGLVVEVGIGDGGEEGILDGRMDNRRQRLLVMQQDSSHRGEAAGSEEKHIHSGSGGRLFATDTTEDAAGVVDGFLTLEAKHNRRYLIRLW